MPKGMKDVRALVRVGKMSEAGVLLGQLASDEKASGMTLKAAAQFFYEKMHDGEKAWQFIRRAVKMLPKDAEVHILAAAICLQLNRIEIAEEFADRALALAPDLVEGLVIYAAVKLVQSEYTEAETAISRALEIDPDHIGAKYQKLRVLITQGAIDETLSLVNEILDAMPDMIEVLSIYVSAADLKPGDPIIQRMRDEILPRFSRTNHPRKPSLLGLLGKACNDVGDYDDAIRFFQQAKATAKNGYDPRKYSAFVASLSTQVSRADFFQRGGRDEQPVLIVGMPRSGSTLLEQVLSGHPEIASAGEHPSLRALVKSVGLDDHDGPRMAKAIKEMPAAAAQRLGQRYLDETGNGRALRVVDKSLHNYELLGFFAVMFPKAKILNIQRDPLDNCVACYFQRLPEWHRYTQTLEGMGQNYLQYRRLMAHWKKELPNPIMEVKYEDLVSDLEGRARAVIDFLGLEWDPACLDFQSSKNRVQTVSVAQVRKPLYTSSMQRWRRYEKHLDPLKQQLLPLYPNGFDAPAQ